MTTVNKIYSALTLFSLLLVVLLVVSCRNNDNEPQPVTINGNHTGANSEPADGCPSGYEWNNATGRCEIPGAALNINPSLITWNTAQAQLVDVPNEPGIKAYVTPGTLNGAAVGKSVMYRGGLPTTESILFRIRPVTGTTDNNTDYFTPSGKFLGILKTRSNQVTGFTPADNPPAPAERNCWSSCVLYNIDVLNQNAVLWIACVYWSPQCAGIITISCAAHCATH